MTVEQPSLLSIRQLLHVIVGIVVGAAVGFGFTGEWGGIIFASALFGFLGWAYSKIRHSFLIWSIVCGSICGAALGAVFRGIGKNGAIWCLAGFGIGIAVAIIYRNAHRRTKSQNRPEITKRR